MPVLSGEFPAERTPHDWIVHHETMPPSAHCRRCKTRRGYDPRRGRIYTVPGLPFLIMGEPQCYRRQL